MFAKGTLEQDGFAWRVEGGVRRLRRQRRRLAEPGARHASRSRRRPDRRAPPEPQQRLQAGGHPRERLALSRQGRPSSSARRSRSRRSRSPPPAREDHVRREAGAKPRQRSRRSASPPSPSPGAPKEPPDEILLSARAKRLAAWVEAHPKRTAADVNHWLYQHNWIVTGAALRLVGRRRGAPHARRRRRSASRSSGASAPRASRLPAPLSPRVQAASK